jgi:tetratricopeptide (TPR) repeat protein
MKIKNTLSIVMIFAVLLGVCLACKNPAAGLTDSKCAMNLPKLDTAKEYLERASVEMIEGNYDCAFDDCQTALKLDSKNTTALACRGAVYRQRERFDWAQADFDEALRLDPGNEMVLYHRSLLYKDTKSYERALADINAIINNSPFHYYYAVRAEIYFDQGDYENAARDYTAAIRLKPDNQDYYAKRARVYRNSKQIELAEADELKSRELQQIEEVSTAPETDQAFNAMLNYAAVNLPKPVYPPAARAVQATGRSKCKSKLTLREMSFRQKRFQVIRCCALRRKRRRGKRNLSLRQPKEN